MKIYLPESWLKDTHQLTQIFQTGSGQVKQKYSNHGPIIFMCEELVPVLLMCEEYVPIIQM